MKALRFDGSLKLATNLPVPRRSDEALIKVHYAGICNTDIEITKGYAGFTGTLGHEFVGSVVESPDPAVLGKRVAGEINVGCGSCGGCLAGDSRHCQTRSVLGIKDRDGAFAEYVSLPPQNLIEIPDHLTDEEAVFIEPLAAACQILDQVEVGTDAQIALIGDGKLAQLIARALSHSGCRPVVIGKHTAKLDELSRFASRVIRVDGGRESAVAVLRQTAGVPFDIVVEASGSPSGLSLATEILRPKGTIVLKSTHHHSTMLDTSMIVVNELTIVGSRCGKFNKAIQMLEKDKMDLKRLIDDIFSLEDGVQAIEKASQSSSMKVLLRVT